MKEPKLLIYIVSYNRIEYTKGTILAISKVKPNNSQIIICDNGSTDGTREWLDENQERYQLGIIKPEQNLRVGGAWTLLTRYYKPEDFDYILLLDNDCWVLPDVSWFEQCLEIFKLDSKIGSLGLFKERKPGYFAKEQNFDSSFNNKVKHNKIEYFDTVYYAGARLDKFNIWHQTMSNWPHKFIGDKIGRHYNSLGVRTIKLHPGMIVDISTYDFKNKNHIDYNKNFYEMERDIKEYERVSNLSLSKEEVLKFVKANFGESHLKFIL